MTPQHNDKTIAQAKEELIKKQCDAAIEVCEKYEYPSDDEALCCLVEDTARFAFDAADKLHREAAQGLIEYMDNLGVGEEIIEAYKKKIGAP